MKKILFAVLLLTSFSYLSKLNAQTSCGAVANIDISKISVATVNGQCQVTFDLQYDLTANPGANYAGIYFYTGAAPTGLNGSGTVPSTTTLNSAGYSNVVGSLQINIPSTTNAIGKTATVYTGSESNNSNPTTFLSGLDYTRTTIGTTDHYTINAIKIFVPMSDHFSFYFPIAPEGFPH